MPRPTVTAAQRRARLAVRHGLATEHRRTSVLDACRATVCFHATESASVHVAAYARADVDHAAVEAALYTDRSVVKQLAMRRTLFGFPRELLPAVWGSASARVADQQIGQTARELTRAGVVADEPTGRAWIAERLAMTADRLRTDGPATTSELRRAIPELDLRVEFTPAAATSAGPLPIAARMLVILGATGQVVRGENAGSWRLNKPRWTLTEDWLGEPRRVTSAEDGYAELIRRWLHAFGPGTEADLCWWLGSTKSAVRAALAMLGAVEVELVDSGETGYLLPDDLAQVPAPKPWAALLPALDPTLMGWKGRDHYFDPAHRSELFDTNGNGGQTAWWDGRVIGGWFQHADGRVEVIPLVDLPRPALRALTAEADRLSALLAGDTVNSIYASSLVRRHVQASRAASDTPGATRASVLVDPAEKSP